MLQFWWVYWLAWAVGTLAVTLIVLVLALDWLATQVSLEPWIVQLPACFAAVAFSVLRLRGDFAKSRRRPGIL